MAATDRATAGSDLQRVEIASVDALHDWLGAHHGQQNSIWLVTYKKHTGAKYVSTGQVLDARIAFGWIDGRRMKLDEDRTMQLISPRKTEAWAQTYKDRAARLMREGRMQPAGLAAIERSKRLGLWDVMADVDALEVPDDLAEALGEAPHADSFFSSAAPSYRRNVLRWIKIAKRAETRAKRIALVVDLSARGAKVPQM